MGIPGTAVLLHPSRAALAVPTTQSFGSRPTLTPLFRQDVELRSPDTREAGMPQHAAGGVEQSEGGARARVHASQPRARGASARLQLTC